MSDVDSMGEQAGLAGISPERAGGRSATAGVPARSGALRDANRRIQELERQLAEQREQNRRLLVLNAFEPVAQSAPDVERMAQRMAKMLAQIFAGAAAAVYGWSPSEKRLKLVASAGQGASELPTSLAVDFEALVQHIQAGEEALSLHERGFAACLAAPLLRLDGPQGLAVIADARAGALQRADLPVLEAAAARLSEAWEYARSTETLTDFVQSIANLSMIQGTGSLLEMIASMARRTLDASVTVVATLHQQEWLVRGSGKAPLLFHSLQNGALSFLEEALHSSYTFRMRDLRNDPRSAVLQIDAPELCTLLACPIRINGVASGILLAFGKAGGVPFLDRDVFLAELLASHAALNLESCYLNQELRGNLQTTQLLYGLSLQIVQAETLQQAASGIASTALQLLQARRCGLLLFAPDGRKEAEVLFPETAANHQQPLDLVVQAMNSRQTIYLSESEQVTQVAIPLQTPRRCFGALWIELPEAGEDTRRPTEELHFLVNQAAVALERSILSEETRYQAHELAQAYLRLNESYDQTLKALMRALDARDRETEGHSERVTNLAVRLGAMLGLPKPELKALERGALLHDIGKIGISDTVLLKRGSLTSEEWEQMRRHPQIGAEIIQAIPALHDALPVIAFHQERWNGSGYPLKLSMNDIPLLARIFAVIDVYDALTCDRPYRQASLSHAQALEYLQAQAETLFDPLIVERFVTLMQDDAQAAAEAERQEPPTRF